MNPSGDSIRVVHPLFQEEDDGSIPISPLQLHIGRVHVKTAILLNAQWHSRFPKVDESNIIRNRRQVCYAAEYKNHFYAVAIWSDPIAANRLKDGHLMLELRRMAIADNAPKNTASRMISVMTRLIKRQWPELVALVSYQDTGAHEGTIYKASGWTNASEQSCFVDWSGTLRKRNAAQSTSPKIRWEKRYA
jgi:hypothetical protein